MRENAASKGRRYLIEGRLIVTHARPGVSVRATCRGDGTVWHLGWDAGSWHCDCPARSDQCSHLLALRLTTAPDLVAGQPARQKRGTHR